MRAAAATLLLAACLLAPVQAQRRRTLKDDNFEHITQVRVPGCSAFFLRPHLLTATPTLRPATPLSCLQAATGQTTGIWFVNFCSPKARACKEELAGAWEELAKELLQGQVRAAAAGASSCGLAPVPARLQICAGAMLMPSRACKETGCSTADHVITWEAALFFCRRPS